MTQHLYSGPRLESLLRTHSKNQDAEVPRKLIVSPLLAADKQESQRQILARFKDAEREVKEAEECLRLASAEAVTVAEGLQCDTKLARRVNRRAGYRKFASVSVLAAKAVSPA
jgi:hypothetical protein